MSTTHQTPETRQAAAEQAVADAWSALLAAAAATDARPAWQAVGDPQTPATRAAARRHDAALRTARRVARETGL